jgi:hypothetical protein
MYVDGELEFSSAQDITANDTVSVYSTNHYDLGLASRDFGNGVPLYLVVTVTTALVGASAACDVALLSDATDAAMDSGSTVHSTLGQIGATAAAGTTLIFPIPPYNGTGPGELLRYIGVRFTANGGNITTGNVDAFITNTPQKYKSYAKGYTIS